MTKASRAFQVFVKPIGAICNLGCQYCYYLEKKDLYPSDEDFRMSYEILEKYIKQHIEACSEDVISFSWHGGEPTMLGLEYFKKIVELQRKYLPKNKRIFNGVQTNGTLLNEELCQFFSKEGFAVGISIDGPSEIHNKHRLTKDHKPTHELTMNGYRILQKYGVHIDVLCAVNSYNVHFPLQVYRFFKDIGAQYLTFMPVVDLLPNSVNVVSSLSVSAEDWGVFLCTIFDEWVSKDVGSIKVQIFEEALRTAFNQEHSLCIFRPVCGDIPVIEHNGDFYSCDHYVKPEYLLGNIETTHLGKLLENPKQKEFGRAKLETLPSYCRECDVRNMCNGECPKNRFITTPDGEKGLNYLCVGYQQFFNHCRPFVSEVADLWRQQNKK
ncbi:anaerobic sulfatase maturase [Candidatus Bathyarchaeota archaeon]|nr:anaerobic sulfatase maturase [Candidatus Bathyarchaeota archaeon]